MRGNSAREGAEERPLRNDSAGNTQAADEAQPSYPNGDYNADGFSYDYPNAPSFGRSVPTDRQSFLQGVFRSSDFPRPQLGQAGNLGRNIFNGPGLANVNVNASKAFRIPWFTGEGATMEVRGELFNVSVSQGLPRAVQFDVHLAF